MEDKISKIRKKLNLKHTIPGLALGLLTACAPSQKEIQEKIDNVPREQQHSLVLNYDKKLLHNVDSLVVSGKKMEKAIEEGHCITWEQACAMMPNRQSEWTGENWVVKQEAEKQLNNSREKIVTTILSPHPVYNGKTTNIVMRPVQVSHYEYRSEYRDNLEKEIKNKESTHTKNQDNSKLDMILLKQTQNQNN